MEEAILHSIWCSHHLSEAKGKKSYDKRNGIIILIPQMPTSIIDWFSFFNFKILSILKYKWSVNVAHVLSRLAN